MFGRQQLNWGAGVAILLVVGIFTLPSGNAFEGFSTYNSQTLPLLTAQLPVQDEKDQGEGGPSSRAFSSDVLVSDIGLDSKEYHRDYSVEEVDENGVRKYIVQKGDTLSEIAEKFDVSVNTIKWENNLKGSTLRVGQELRILPTTGVLHTVRKGDTLLKIAERYEVPVEDIRIYNDIDATKLRPGMKIMVPNGVKQETSQKAVRVSSKQRRNSSKKRVQSPSPYETYFIRPAHGRVSSFFGPRWRGYHYGVDVANHGSSVPVIAAASGTVTKTVSYCRVGSRSCGGGYGNYIVVQHSNGTVTKYAHLKRVYVKPGDRVVQGQKIALMGNTGRSTGQHLHFEIQNARTGAKINPNFLYR